MNLKTYVMNFDGGCRPNPGEMTSAYIIKEYDGSNMISETIKGGHGTSNVAEYTALISGLKKAIELGVKHIMIYGDSNLVIKQVKGSNKANAKMKPYRDEVRELLKKFYTSRLTHVPRDKNKEADKLCRKGVL